MVPKRTSITFFTEFGLILLVIITRALSAGKFLHMWDSVQFALGMSEYDITRHQPHPPGYPGYIGFGWLVRKFVQDDNSALVITGIFFMALLVIVMYRLGTALFGLRGGFIAGLLTALNPLLWYFSSIALAYICGVAIAAIACWAAYTSRGRMRWSVPFLAGLASVFWLPAGILILPVCVACAARACPDEEKKNLPLHIIKFFGCFLVPLIIGYLPAIIDTGGLSPYLAEIQSESGKHIFRFGEWIKRPVDEFLATTASIQVLLDQGLGMGKWLLLVLLIPITGEKGCPSKRVIALLPLGIAGFAALYWGNLDVLRMAGIVAFLFACYFLLPKPTDRDGLRRFNFLWWWLVPGLVLFVLVYVNYVGILVFFLPPLILLMAWAIERSAAFMALQTIKDQDRNAESEEGAQAEENGEEIPQIKGPDIRVEKLVLWVLIILVVMNDIGGFLDDESQESFWGIINNDVYIENVMTAVEGAPYPQDELLILAGPDPLGSPGKYRHWMYYFPDARCIWTKYLINYPIRENSHIWVAQNRHQDKVLPDEIFQMEIDGVDDPPLAAAFSLLDAKALIVFPDEMDHFGGTAIVTPLFIGEGEDREPVCYLIETGDAERVVFLGGEWVDWIDENGDIGGGWVSAWEGKWWLE